MGKPSRRILRSNRLDGQTDGLLEGLVGAGAEATQDGLELGEGLLDRRQVRGVGRQEEQGAAARRQGLADAGGLVSAQIVEDHHLPGPQPRRQFLADVPRKGLGIHGPLNQPWFVQSVGGKCRHQRGVVAVVARHRAARALVMRRPAIEARQGGVGAAFVDKDELRWIELGDLLAPGGTRCFVALAGCQ